MAKKKETPNPKDKPKSKAKGTRPKSGARLPALEEKGRRDKAFEVFLRAYSKTGRKQDSALLAGVSCRTVQKWREEFPDFEERFQIAHEQWRDILKAEVYRRAVEGWEEPVYQKGECIGYVRKFDSNLLMFAMKQADASYKDRQETNVNVATQINNSTTNIHGNVTIIEDADWYGNKAHDMATEAVAAHAPGALIPGEVQGGGLRPSLEQDGNGDAGGSAGPRELQGAV